MVINGNQYAPRITNSVLIRYAENNGINLTDLGRVLSSVSYSFASGLFLFAANREGATLTEADMDAELDSRIEFLQEVVMYVAQQLTPGEEKPGKTRPMLKLKKKS